MLTSNKTMFKNENIELHTFISNSPDYAQLSILDSIERFRSHQISNNIKLYLSSKSKESCVQPDGIEFFENTGCITITSPECITLQENQPIIVRDYKYHNGYIIINSFEHEAKVYQPISEPSDTEPQFSLSEIIVNYYDKNLFLSRLDLSTFINTSKSDYPINIRRLDIVKLFLQSKPSIGNIQKKEFLHLLKVFLKEYRKGIYLEHFEIKLSTFKDVYKTFPPDLIDFKSGSQSRVPKNNHK